MWQVQFLSHPMRKTKAFMSETLQLFVGGLSHKNR